MTDEKLPHTANASRQQLQRRLSRLRAACALTLAGSWVRRWNGFVGRYRASARMEGMMRKIPTPDTTELTGRDAWDALVAHFGVEDVPTEPMALDELPSMQLVPTDADRWAQALRMAGLTRDDAKFVADLWEHAR
jgi:hypothetical protein